MTGWTITVMSPHGATSETKCETEAELAPAIAHLAEQIIKANQQPGGSGEIQERKTAGKKA